MKATWRVTLDTAAVATWAEQAALNGSSSAKRGVPPGTGTSWIASEPYQRRKLIVQAPDPSVAGTSPQMPDDATGPFGPCAGCGPGDGRPWSQAKLPRWS